MSDQWNPVPRDPGRLAEACLEMTGQILQKHRYRIAGTPECRDAAHEVAARLEPYCHRVDLERFILHPDALWYVGRAVAIAYVLSSLLLAIGGVATYIAALLCLIGLVYAVAQYVLCLEIFDRLFPSADGYNVVATLEPAEAVTRQIVLVGHHDSPYTFSFLEKHPNLAFIRFLLAMLFYAWLCVYSLAASVQQALSPGSPASGDAFFWIAVAGLPFVLQLFFMMSRAPSPGAGDNLNSTCMAVSVAHHFWAARGGPAALRYTRLIVLSTDGEEIGQRGAIRYVAGHRSALQAVPTLAFNTDSIYRCRDLKVLTRDRNGTCPLSEGMAGDIRAVAEDVGLRLAYGPLPFGGGGTDAAAFAAAGIPAASIIGVSTATFGQERVYHTSRDTVAQIEAEAVRAVLALTIGYIERIDGLAAAEASEIG
jgi:hypothetical protein